MEGKFLKTPFSSDLFTLEQQSPGQTGTPVIGTNG
jgi:hypothetical protein